MTGRTLDELAELIGATLEGDGARVVEAPAALDEAGPTEIGFVAHPRFASAVATTRAGALVVPRGLERTRDDVAFLRCDDPDRAFSAVVDALLPPDAAPAPGVHPTAVVDPDAEIGEGVAVGPLCVIGAGAVVGRGTVLHAGVVLGPGSRIGEDCELHPGAVLYRNVRVGSRCVLHAGVVLGADGFGYEPSPEGWSKIAQRGTVAIGDDVEIGANTTIDRGRFGPTRVGDGCKIDNLVQIAHNVRLGANGMIVAQVGIAGSARIGERVVLGGQAAVPDHVTIGDGARLGARAAPIGDLEGGQDYFGTPALPRREALRILAVQQKLPAMSREIDALRARNDELLQRIEELERAVARERAR